MGIERVVGEVWYKDTFMDLFKRSSLEYICGRIYIFLYQTIFFYEKINKMHHIGLKQPMIPTSCIHDTYG